MKYIFYVLTESVYNLKYISLYEYNLFWILKLISIKYVCATKKNEYKNIYFTKEIFLELFTILFENIRL